MSLKVKIMVFLKLLKESPKLLLIDGYRKYS